MALASPPWLQGGNASSWIDGAAPRTFAHWLDGAADAAPFDDVAFLVPRLTLGGLGLLRERFPKPARLRILLPVRALPKGAPGPLRYTLLDTTPAELVLDNQLAQGADAQRVRRWLGAEAIAVRTVWADASLPGMAWVGGALVVGNPELTRECLDPARPMAEAGLFAPDAASRDALVAVFERLWAQGQDCKQALRDRLDAYRPVTPQFLYYLSLWHLFRDRLPEWRGVLAEDRRLKDTPIWTKLYAFQRHGAIAVLRTLEREKGCILADSVGLGKTYTALAVIKAYARRNQRVLVLCPKKLRDNWSRFLQLGANNPIRDANGDPDFAYYLLNHTDLGLGRADAGRGAKVPLADVFASGFGLIVIDESHNFRNRGGRRYAFLLDHLRRFPETRLLLLSATPVSNRLRDLANQLALVYRVDPGKKDAETPDDRGDAARFRVEVGRVVQSAQRLLDGYARAHANEPTAFSPDTLAALLPEAYFALLARFTIARSRDGITRFYDNAAREIGVFPAHLPSDNPDPPPPLDTEGALGDVESLSETLLSLTYAAYNPTDWLRAGIVRVEQGNLRDETRQRSLAALMRINTLKRLESSIDAFRQTLRDALLTRTERTLGNLERGVVCVPWVTAVSLLGEARARELSCGQRDGAADAEREALLNVFGDEGDGLEEALEGGDVALPAEQYFDVTGLRAALECDRAQIVTLLAQADAIDLRRDAKFQALYDRLRAKWEAPFNPGNRKALVFTAYADTADYLARALATSFPDVGVACVTGSTGKIFHGGRHPQNAAMGDILFRFAPGGQKGIDPKTHVPLQVPDVPIDWVVATDCLSEGQNLQDCDLVVNYDIHWNPVRLTQRIGRIDRIGSPNARIRVVFFWPCRALDAYINLERRVRAKSAAGGLVSVDADVLSTDRKIDLAYRQQQLLDIQRGRLTQGILPEAPARAFDDYLAELDAWLQADDRAAHCDEAPLGLCAVTPATLTEAFAGSDLPVPTQGGALFLFRRAGLDGAERAANPLGDCYLLAVDLACKPLADGALTPLPPERALALLRALCRDRAEADAALATYAETIFTPARRNTLLDGAFRALGLARETTRRDLLFGDVPFDFHTGLTDDAAALTLLTLVFILPEPMP